MLLFVISIVISFTGKYGRVLAHFLTLPVRRRALGGPDFIKTLWLME